MSDDGWECLRISEEVADIEKNALMAELVELVDMADMSSDLIVF